MKYVKFLQSSSTFLGITGVLWTIGIIVIRLTTDMEPMEDAAILNMLIIGAMFTCTSAILWGMRGLTLALLESQDK